MARPHAPHSRDSGPSEVFEGANEQPIGLTSSDEEKAGDSDEVDDEDLVSCHEFAFAKEGDAVVVLTCHDILFLLKWT